MQSRVATLRYIKLSSFSDQALLQQYDTGTSKLRCIISPINHSPVIAEMYGAIKPERDTRVANRMIGAALGVRVPKAAAAPVKAAPVVDAWDD